MKFFKTKDIQVIGSQKYLVYLGNFGRCKIWIQDLFIDYDCFWILDSFTIEFDFNEISGPKVFFLTIEVSEIF